MGLPPVPPVNHSCEQRLPHLGFANSASLTDHALSTWARGRSVQLIRNGGSARVVYDKLKKLISLKDKSHFETYIDVIL